MSFVGNGRAVATSVLPDEDAPLPPLTFSVTTSKPGHSTVPFLRGPIAAEWLNKMTDTKSTDACKVGLALWQARGMRNDLVVQLNWFVRQCFGIEKNASSRGLKKLKEAGLVEIIEQRKGSHPIVRIIVSGGTSSEVAGK